MNTWIRMASLAVGLALLGLLLAQHDLGALAAALAAVGWGVLWATLAHLPTVWLDMLAWRHLVAAARRPGRMAMFGFRWIGESVNALLPAAQVGGDVARARLLALAGVPGAEAGASVVVDFTLGLATQVVFSLVGVAALLAFVAPGDLGAPVVAAVAGVVAVAALVYGIQRAGAIALVGRFLGTLARGESWRGVAGGVAAMEDRLRELYARRTDLLVAAGWRLASWFAHAAEVWIVLAFLGVDAGFVAALVIESLTAAIRSAAFMIPGALGAQEGGIVVLFALLGLPPDAAWAVAMVKRIRELGVGAPGLMLWAMAERDVLRRLLGRGRP